MTDQPKAPLLAWLSLVFVLAAIAVVVLFALYLFGVVGWGWPLAFISTAVGVFVVECVIVGVTGVEPDPALPGGRAED